MLTFTLDNGVVGTLRTSGTEPKLKYYVEYCGDPAETRDRDSIISELDSIVNGIIEHFVEPEKNNLTLKSDIPLVIDRISSC